MTLLPRISKWYRHFILTITKDLVNYLLDLREKAETHMSHMYPTVLRSHRCFTSSQVSMYLSLVFNIVTFCHFVTVMPCKGEIFKKVRDVLGGTHQPQHTSNNTADTQVLTDPVLWIQDFDFLKRQKPSYWFASHIY